MPTGLDIIKASMRLIGVLAQGETPSQSEADDALSRLNLMLAGWSAERIAVYSREVLTVSLSGAQSYTIGPGAAINTPIRPPCIEAASISSGTGSQVQIEIVDENGWMNIPDRSATATFALKLFYDRKYPTGTIYLWPRPAASGSLQLIVWSPLPSFTLNDTVDLPLGYQQAIEFNLAVALAPEYGRPVPAELAALAGNAKSSLAQLNISMVSAGNVPSQPQAPAGNG